MTLATDIIEFVIEVASIPDLICQATLIICSASGMIFIKKKSIHILDGN